MTERGDAETFARGVSLHNAHKFFEAHEEWELLWRAEKRPDIRLLLQGLIQITAAFHKLFVMRKPASAEKLLARGMAKLENAPDAYEGVDLKRFRSDAARCEERFALGTVDESTVPKFQLAVLERS